jgi:acetolactate decarboxylase
MHDNTTPRSGVLHLCAPVNALVEGIYEQKLPLAEILKNGDFGLGTFDRLDGEMIILDNRIYQITGDGRVAQVDDTALTPFACVTFYQPLSHDELEGETSYPEFLEWLRRLLPSPNLCYAIRVEGVFAQVRVRSVPKQDSYRPLVEVAAEQPVFESCDIEGTLAGFFTPAFMGSVNVPGLHLHFLSDNREYGGHLLSCMPRKVRAGVQFLTRVEVSLPLSFDFLTCDFQRDTGKDIEKAEKG